MVPEKREKYCSNIGNMSAKILLQEQLYDTPSEILTHVLKTGERNIEKGSFSIFVSIILK